jgi:hypothetical protein
MCSLPISKNAGKRPPLNERGLSMSKIDRNRCGWILTRVWVNALEETARDFHGTRPKEFCMRAYEHATDSWIKLLEDEYGIVTPRADSFIDAIKNYIQAGIAGGLFSDEELFELTPLPSGGVNIKVKECQYLESCQDMLDNKHFSVKTLTCPRIGCFRAAASLLTNTEASYDVHEVKPGVGCEGVVEPR